MDGQGPACFGTLVDGGGDVLTDPLDEHAPPDPLVPVDVVHLEATEVSGVCRVFDP